MMLFVVQSVGIVTGLWQLQYFQIHPVAHQGR